MVDRLQAHLEMLVCIRRKLCPGVRAGGDLRKVARASFVSCRVITDTMFPGCDHNYCDITLIKSELVSQSSC